MDITAGARDGGRKAQEALLWHGWNGHFGMVAGDDGGTHWHQVRACLEWWIKNCLSKNAGAPGTGGR